MRKLSGNSGVVIDMQLTAFTTHAEAWRGSGRPKRRLPRGLHRLLLTAMFLGVWFAAAPAGAAEVVDLRVGRHANFTRVVFELDAPAGYSLQRNQTGKSAPELIITLDAKAKAQSVSLDKSLIDGVELKQLGGKSVARIRLNQSGLSVKEMILPNPPRIVLDVLSPSRPVAKKVAPKKVEKVAVTAKPEPTLKAVTPRAATPTPTKTARTSTTPVAPAATPTPSPSSKPATRPATRTTAKATPRPSSDASPVASINRGAVPAPTRVATRPAPTRPAAKPLPKPLVKSPTPSPSQPAKRASPPTPAAKP